MYDFTNRVAREVAEDAPDKWIAQLGLLDLRLLPRKVTPDKHVAVQMCLHTRNWWCPSMEAQRPKMLTAWRTPAPTVR